MRVINAMTIKATIGQQGMPSPGLVNLPSTLESLLLKHEKGEDWPAEFRPRPKRPCLEAQVVDLADSTAYNSHDIEDGLHAGMFTEDELSEASTLWRRSRERVQVRYVPPDDESQPFEEPRRGKDGDGHDKDADKSEHKESEHKEGDAHKGEGDHKEGAEHGAGGEHPVFVLDDLPDLQRQPA